MPTQSATNIMTQITHPPLHENGRTEENCLANGFVSLKEHHNIWQSADASKGSFIVDGENYFRSLREAAMQAERYICILAWDLMGDIELIRGEKPDDEYSTKLVELIYQLVDQKPELEIYILLWDYSVVYLVEREWIPFSRFRQEPHDRIHLVTDQSVPVGASHHQKVVVLDGQFAFCGGIDLSAWRWDTEEHAPEEKRRQTPKGESYQPYHDIHAAVTGEAATTLDQLCRERWERATGKAAPWREPVETNKIWPPSLDVDFEKAKAAFALTYAEYKEYPAVRQIERLHLDVIAAAKSYIYIENQYLSSHRIADALAERLQEKDGPEVVIVLTQDTGGWLEEGTLGLLRCRLLEKLVEADTYNRFGAYYPHTRDDSGNESQVYVHAKALICDDRAVMIGSANLSNRSMKVDSEVMMALGLDEAAEAAPKLLRRLLGIHLGTSPNKVDEALKKRNSINQTIRSLRENNLHQLRDLNAKCPGPVCRKLADSQFLDPDEPLDPGYWLKKTIPGANDSSQTSQRGRYLKIAAAIAFVVLIGIGLKEAWGGVIDKESVETFFQSLNQSAWTLPLLFGIFFLAGLAGISLNLLLVSATLVIGPWSAFGAGFLGALLSAVAAFYLGKIAGQPILEKFFAEQLDQLSKKIQNRGVISVAVLRLVPVAPFVVINLVAGLSKLKITTFVAGSIIGMLPGMAGVVFVTSQAKSVYKDPNLETGALLIGGILLLVGLTFGIKRFYKKR